MPDPLKVTIDGIDIEANPGELVIDAAERSGVYIPRFCYHHRMKPVGMCRMCLVEIDAGRGPALQPACMIPVSPDMKVDTTSERTRKAQDGVLEFLLINHPLDCPVCDKGGECPLQDQTVAFGPGESRFVEEKRHYEKPIPISDLVYLDRERCILCDRCTRFAKEVAGDPLIHFQGRGSNTEVNTFPDEPFSSYFSGNTVQICPVGALTATPYRFKARPWDIDEVTSTCQTCAVGCSVTVQSSQNKVLRFQGVDNDAVNWGWLCDRGRFNFEALHAPERLKEPTVGGKPARWADALKAAAAHIKAATQETGPSAVAFLGGAHMTNEAQYAWARLAKGVVGTDHVDASPTGAVPAAFLAGLPRATIAQACQPKGTIVLLGPDPKEALPVLYLRLRHAVVEDGATLIELGHGVSGMTRYARHALHGQPGGELVELAHHARGLVPEGSPVTVVVGRTALTEDPAVVMEAAMVFAEAGATFLPAVEGGNALGAVLAGLAPGLLPGGVSLEAGRSTFASSWGLVPAAVGQDTAGILRAAVAGSVKTLVLLGADPLGTFGDLGLAEAALEAATVIAVDSFPTASVAKAAVVLPAAAFGEVSGTTTNLEGRVQTVNQKVTPPGTARPEWMIAAELAHRLGGDLSATTSDELWDQLRGVSPAHAAIDRAALASAPDGIVVHGGGATPVAVPRAQATALDPSALRLVATATLYDNAATTQHAPSLRHLPPENQLRLHPADFAALHVEAGTPVRILTNRGDATLAAFADDGVVRGTAAVLANVPGAPLNQLGDAARPVTDIRLEVPR